MEYILGKICIFLFISYYIIIILTLILSRGRFQWVKSLSVCLRFYKEAIGFYY
ncbi:Uncharacterised protein [Mycobacteroides abscessus subsp. abscessus]|nr:Uncharacterised protein [Mycobacteroides abscessus subsp. abscessus]